MRSDTYAYGLQKKQVNYHYTAQIVYYQWVLYKQIMLLCKRLIIIIR